MVKPSVRLPYLRELIRLNFTLKIQRVPVIRTRFPYKSANQMLPPVSSYLPRMAPSESGCDSVPSVGLRPGRVSDQLVVECRVIKMAFLALPLEQMGSNLVYDGLSINTHMITLQATDEQGLTCSTQRILTVGTPPTVIINTPQTGSVWGSDFSFRYFSDLKTAWRFKYRMVFFDRRRVVFWCSILTR